MCMQTLLHPNQTASDKDSQHLYYAIEISQAIVTSLTHKQRLSLFKGSTRLPNTCAPFRIAMLYHCLQYLLCLLSQLCTIGGRYLLPPPGRSNRYPCDAEAGGGAGRGSAACWQRRRA